MLIAQEKSRLNDPETWLNRLMLADKQGGNLSYLKDIENLADNITLSNIKRMAEQIYNPNSVQVWADTPRP